ncbi:MAG: TonB-dependent receptor [Bacteroidales bacterium]|nr:TonB-dependent receptor [Bacteroidales bacterium]
MGTVSAQITVSGKLTDQKGAPLIAASVAELNTTNGTFTELDGTWTLTVKNAESVLEFSYLGFVAQTMKVGAKKTFNVALKPDAIMVDPVVKIGYAAVKAEDATGSNTVLGGEEISKAPVLAVDQALQGKAAGVSVTSNSGTPGAAMDIVIRGRGTTGDARPLYVVDGVPQGYEYRGDPGNIESLTILKDASSCAIYGARGANGVVLITTKGGNEAADYEYVNINFDGYKGIQKAWKQMDVCSGDEFAALMGSENTVANGFGGNNANWQDTIFRVATIQKYRVSAEGGSAKSSWTINAGYQDQDGIVRTTNYNRYDFGLKSMYKVNKRLDIGANLGYSQNSQDYVSEGQLEYSAIGQALIFDPTVSGGKNPASAASGQSFGNPEVKLAYEDNQKTGYGIGGGAWLNYKLDFLLDGLEFKSQFNYGKWANEDKQYVPEYFVSTTQNNGVSYIENTINGGYNWSVSNTLTYTFNIYDKIDTTKINHGFRFLLGHEALYDAQEAYKTRIENIGPEDYQHYIISGENGTTWAETWQVPSEHSMLSYIGRMEYSYRDKYLVNFTLRRDGSSRFGAAYKYGYFPSLGLAWKLNKEMFFQRVDFLKNNINLFKIRGGWGKIGNENIANYQYVSSMVADPESGYNFGGTSVSGVVSDGIANEELHWEEATSWDLGTDISFWKNKLMFNFDYFVKNNVDNLVAIAVPSVVGCDNKNPTVNAGKIMNRGYELSLVYRNNHKFSEDSKYTFNYSIGGNLSHNYNEVKELGGTVLYGGNVGRSSNVYACRTLEGYPIASFWGYKVDGVFSSYEEINQSAQPTAKLGEFKIKDVDGDGQITSNDIVCIGNPNPDFTYGFNFDAAFAGFDLGLAFQGVAGNDIFNNTKYYLDGAALNSNVSTRRLDVWSSENKGSSEPTDAGQYTNTTGYPSSAYIENGSYFRLKNVTLGYTVPENIVEKAKIKTLRFYIQAQNLLTFTKYSGFDPEIGTNTSLNWEGPEYGVDRGVYPQARSFVFGVNLGF